MKYSSDLKSFKEWEFTKRVVYNLFLSLFVTLILVVLVIKIFNVRLDEVLSDSMSPIFKTNDVVVVVKQDNYKVGDIIEYVKEGLPGATENVTHRIVDYDETTGFYTTRGEHHGAADDSTITKSQIRGKVVAIWYNGATIYKAIRSNYFLILTIIIGAWVLSVTLSGEAEQKKHNILNV